jgi:hypothetical protein
MPRTIPMVLTLDEIFDVGSDAGTPSSPSPSRPRH